VTISECDDNGEAVKTVEIASKHTMLLPAFKGVDAVASLADVATGFEYKAQASQKLWDIYHEVRVFSNRYP
jgi:hypothetical protein